MTTKRIALSLVGTAALLSAVIAMLPRVKTELAPTHIVQATLPADVVPSERATSLKSSPADPKMVTVDSAQPRHLKAGSSTQATRKTEELDGSQDSDRDKEADLILKRNGKEIRVRREGRPGERFDQPAEAMRAYLQERLPAGETELPIDRYFTAREQIKQMEQFSTPNNRLTASEAKLAKDGYKTEAAPFIWTSLGPGNVGGRTRALLIDPVNPNIMYAAGVAGGIWKTTNGGTSWSALDDFMANIAVNSLAFEPGNSSVIYAATGEGFFNADAVRGAGIFKSTDAGVIWTRLASTTTSDFYYVQDIVVSNANAQHVYAATRTGVWRSLDGGANWTLVLASNAANGANGAMDLVMRTDQATDYIYAALGTIAQSHIWRNTDAGGAGVWTDVYTEATMGRTSLAIAPSNQNTIYAMSSCFSCPAGTNPNFPTFSYTDALLAVFRSTSSGDVGSWITQVRNNSANKQDTLLLSNPVYGALNECFGGSNVSQAFNQGWYHNQLAVDPTDPNKIWAAGTDVWRSDNAGVNWAVASYWWFQGNGTPPNNGDPQLAHADNHVIAFHPNYNGTTNQTMLVGNDGGIYKTDNAKDGNVGYVSGTTPSGGTITSTSPICGNEYTPGGFYTVPSPVIWAPLNNGYSVTQFWPGTVYPDGTTYMGGTQDNGTNRGTDALGANAWARINGGDGGYTAVNPTNTNTLYSENTNLSIQRSTNGGSSWATITTGITEASGNFLFTAPFIIDPSDANRLYLGGARVWKTVNGGTNWTSASGFLGFRVSGLAVSPQDANYGLFSGQAGHIWRTQTLTTDATPAGTTSPWLFARPRTDFASWVTFDPSDKNVAYATYSAFNNGANIGHVFKSIDAGVTWLPLNGTGANTIPDIPVHCILVIPNNTSRLYVGTDLGVFVSLDGGINWYKETAFPNVYTESLSANTVAGKTTVYAFTHGRGAFSALITPTAAPANISGQVTTTDGRPVAGVTMSLSGSRSAYAVTDTNGYYRFSNVDTDGFYTVTPSLTNYHFGPDSRSFSLVANKTDAIFTAMPDAFVVGNVIDSSGFYVRQHYVDFLGREPDEGGFNFWIDQLMQCGGDIACNERRRINVSAAYFLSIEFQQTGGLVDSLYRASYGRRPLYAEFMADRQSVAQSVAVGIGDWKQQLAANKQAFVSDWVQRSDFRAAYDGLSNAAFVDALITHAGSGFNGDRSALVAALESGSGTRASVLLQVAENEGFVRAKSNEMFVMMEYFGYLRRDPDDDGYRFWLNKLNQFGGNFEQAEMVKAFISSTEYRQRFGQ